MSANYSGMLKYALLVLSFQKKHLKTAIEKDSYKTGVSYLEILLFAKDL